MKILPNRTADRATSWMLWRWMEIDGRKPGVKYLTRLYVLNTPWGGVKLHWFHAPDPDKACHDHPWSFVSILLRGAYQERRQDQMHVFHDRYVLRRETESQRRGFLDVAHRKAEDVHRITMVTPGAVTLVINGPVRRSWGFYRLTGRDIFGQQTFQRIPWRTFLGVPTETPEV